MNMLSRECSRISIKGERKMVRKNATGSDYWIKDD